jgi:quercetin dioxygenase-like cupin family protein
MPVIPAATAPTFTMPGLAVTGLAAPSRGATETSIWRLTLAPGAPGSEHTIDREEVFVVLAGRAVATIDGDQHHLRPGDALVVPPHRPFSLANPPRRALRGGGRAACRRPRPHARRPTLRPALGGVTDRAGGPARRRSRRRAQNWQFASR